MLTAVRRYAGQGLKPAVFPNDAREEAVRMRPGTYVAGQAMAQPTTLTGANDVQTLTVTGTPTGGSFYLLFNGEFVGPFLFNSTLAQAQAIVDASPQLGKVGGVSQVILTGGPLPGSTIVFTFSGSTVASLWQPLLTVGSNGLTGGSSPAAAVVHTTPGRAVGGQWGAYDPAASDGMERMAGLLTTACIVDINGFVHYGPSNARDAGRGFTIPVYVAGYFRTADITGIDTAGIADMGGRIVWGDPADLTNTGTVVRFF